MNNIAQHLTPDDQKRIKTLLLDMAEIATIKDFDARLTAISEIFGIKDMYATLVVHHLMSQSLELHSIKNMQADQFYNDLLNRVNTQKMH